MDKLYDLMEKMYTELQDFREETSSRFDNIENRLDGLETGQKEIKNLVEELDPKNGSRHLELKESINDLRKDLINVEIITSSNWNEIAKLKNIK